jgi:hypothetical protein
MALNWRRRMPGPGHEARQSQKANSLQGASSAGHQREFGPRSDSRRFKRPGRTSG